MDAIAVAIGNVFTMMGIVIGVIVAAVITYCTVGKRHKRQFWMVVGLIALFVVLYEFVSLMVAAIVVAILAVIPLIRKYRGLAKIQSKPTWYLHRQIESIDRKRYFLCMDIERRVKSRGHKLYTGNDPIQWEIERLEEELASLLRRRDEINREIKRRWYA